MMKTMTALTNTPIIPSTYQRETDGMGIPADTLYNKIAKEVNVAIGEIKYNLIHKAQKDKAEKKTAELQKRGREKSTYQGRNIYDPKAGSEEECYS